MLPCITAHGATLRGVVTGGRFGPVREAVVYLEDVPGRFSPPNQPVAVQQKNFQFVPHILPVVAGASVTFTNDDVERHSVYSPSRANPFDLGAFPPKTARTVTFHREGPVAILCSIHPEMSAYVLVLQNPFFAVTDNQGAYAIADIPKGRYRLAVWHEKAKNPTVQDVDVQNDTELDMGLADYVPTAATLAASKAETARERQAAKRLYANDLGPATLDVSAYPPEVQQGYRLMRERCAQCHTAARPLNAEFVEVKPEGLETLQQDRALFSNQRLWRIEPGVWERYVKRMMNKAGCNTTPEEAKQIWRFLVYDSKTRKLGPAREAWKKHRQELLERFKAQHPARYQELYGGEH